MVAAVVVSRGQFGQRWRLLLLRADLETPDGGLAPTRSIGRSETRGTDALSAFAGYMVRFLMLAATAGVSTRGMSVKDSSTRTRLRRTWRIGAFALVLAMVGGGLAIADTPSDTLTGCLKDNGKIERVALGEEPTKDCKTKDTQVSWGLGGASTGGASFYVKTGGLPIPPLPEFGSSEVRMDLAAGEFQLFCDPGDAVVDGILYKDGVRESSGALFPLAQGDTTPHRTIVIDGVPVGYENAKGVAQAQWTAIYGSDRYSQGLIAEITCQDLP